LVTGTSWKWGVKSRHRTGLEHLHNNPTLDGETVPERCLQMFAQTKPVGWSMVRKGGLRLQIRLFDMEWHFSPQWTANIFTPGTAARYFPWGRSGNQSCLGLQWPDLEVRRPFTLPIYKIGRCMRCMNVPNENQRRYDLSGCVNCHRPNS